jgi:hypothetical protein
MRSESRPVEGLLRRPDSHRTRAAAGTHHLYDCFTNFRFNLLISRSMKNLIFYQILVPACMAMRTRQNFKKHLTI